MWAQAVRDRLSAQNYRQTRTREAVIGYLSDQRYLVTVEHLSDAVAVDPVTVYRVLEVLEVIGAVLKVQSYPGYVTVPQSLRDADFHAIFIDEHAQKVVIRPYTPERDTISPTRAVIEIRGSLSHQPHGAGHSTDSHEQRIPPTTQSPAADAVSELITKTQEHGVSNIPSTTQATTDPSETSTENDKTLDPLHIDRLKRF